MPVRIMSFATALMFAALAALGAAGTANAAITTFKLCNYGSDYRVSASFTGSLWTTIQVHPGACNELRIDTTGGFNLRVTKLGDTGRYFGTFTDRTYPSGRTLVQTWASFGSFTYGKLPY